MKNFLLTVWYKYKDWKWERKCIKYFGAKPEKIILSAEAFDALVERLNQPSDPKVVERLKEIMSKKAPWEQ